MNKLQPFSFLSNTRMQRGQLFGFILLGALLSFEIFNFGSTEFALKDLLGNLHFLGMSWATILALAFCGIDFAGIARLFTPEQGRDEPAEVWYLFGAWILAAVMNAMLTWWGVSVAMLQQPVMGSSVLSQSTLLNTVPIFVALMVWLTRVLIIGTFSIAGERIFSVATTSTRSTIRKSYTKNKYRPAPKKKYTPATQTFRPAPKQTAYSAVSKRQASINEPTYHPIGMVAQSNSDKNQPPWR